MEVFSGKDEDETDIICIDISNQGYFTLNEMQINHLIEWIKENKPQLLEDVS